MKVIDRPERRLYKPIHRKASTLRLPSIEHIGSGRRSPIASRPRVSGTNKTGTTGFYSRIFLVPTKNKKRRLIIDLSRLNTFVGIQGLKMETQVEVRQTIQANDWSFSLDLTDAYLHVPIHRASRK